MELSEIFRKAENKTLEIGYRFNADSFTCTESALGKVKFSWSGNTNYEIEMLTDLHIPRVRGLYYGESGILIYDETVHDNVTGKDVSVKYKVQFNAVFEWRSDYNFHVVQFKRIPEKSETTKIWIFELYNEGMMYLTGEGFPKNRDKAVEKFREAACYDHAGAKNMLAKLGENVESAEELYEQGMEAYNAEDYAKAVELFRKSADMGNDNAQDSIGNCYYNGQGVPQDFKKAVEWYRKSAEQGNMYAQYDLGNSLFDGNGIPQNKAEAVKWWAKSAEQGYDVAQKELGYAYHFGEGVKQDYAKAKEWYLKAIEANNEIAFNNLGVLYRDGLGVKQDFAKAEEYFNKAIEGGCEKAKEHLVKLKQMKK